MANDVESRERNCWCHAENCYVINWIFIREELLWATFLRSLTFSFLPIPIKTYFLKPRLSLARFFRFWSQNYWMHFMTFLKSICLERSLGRLTKNAPLWHKYVCVYPWIVYRMSNIIINEVYHYTSSSGSGSLSFPWNLFHSFTPHKSVPHTLIPLTRESALK
jgi:hypothetical protein